MNKLLSGILLLFLGQTIIWLQIQGMVMWEWWRNHPFVVAMITGVPVAWLFITASRHIIDHYGGLVWPNRLIGFSTGIAVFTILTWMLLGEGITVKTGISLALASCIVLLQLI